MRTEPNWRMHTRAVVWPPAACDRGDAMHVWSANCTDAALACGLQRRGRGGAVAPLTCAGWHQGLKVSPPALVRKIQEDRPNSVLEDALLHLRTAGQVEEPALVQDNYVQAQGLGRVVPQVVVCPAGTAHALVSPVITSTRVLSPA